MKRTTKKTNPGFRRAFRVVFGKESRELLRDRRSLFWLFAPPILLPGIALCALLFIGSQTVRMARDGFPVRVENGDLAPRLVQRFEDTGTVQLLEPSPDPDQDPFGKALFIVTVPPDFAQQLEQSGSATVELVARDSSILTFFGKPAVLSVIQDFSDDLLEERLAARGLSHDWLTPIQVQEGRRVPTESVAVVNDGGEGNSALTTLFLPLMVTSWLLGGGLGLILDTTVGEKERQTIENLLVTPASRSGIVIAKMTVVFIASMAVMGLWLIEGVLLNALAAAGPMLAGVGSGGTAQVLEVILRSSGDVLILILALLLLLVPFTVTLNGLVMAWCTFAANYREANLFMIVMQLGLPASVLLVVFSVPPRVGAATYGIPLFGTIVAIRDLFSSALSVGGLAVGFVSGLAWAAGSLALATWMFNREWTLTRGL